MIKGGLAHLEEVRGADGKLENLYVRVSISHANYFTELPKFEIGRP